MKFIFSLLLPLLATPTFGFAIDVEIGACKAISEQCVSAGYKPGDHKTGGHGLWIDCIGAIARGKSVTGVTASKAEAKTCLKAKRAARK